MIESLISSKTRIKLLLKFFLDNTTVGYLRGLATEFGESSNGVRVELNRLTEAGLLVTFSAGNKRMFKANVHHPLYEQIHQIVRKHFGLDKVVDILVAELPDLQRMYLGGSFNRSKDTGVIDLLLVGDIDKVHLVELIERVENLAHRKVRYVLYSASEIAAGALEAFTPPPLLLWDKSA